MKTFKQFIDFIESTNKFIGYHNTEKAVASRIRKTRFKLQKKAMRKRLYGNGIYFTNEPNVRWGPEAIKVELRPGNPLLDFSGKISYEGNPLGDEVEAIGKTLFRTFHMSDAVKRSLAIEKYLHDNGHDMLITDELNKTIYVVRDESIIKIIG